MSEKSYLFGYAFTFTSCCFLSSFTFTFCKIILHPAPQALMILLLPKFNPCINHRLFLLGQFLTAIVLYKALHKGFFIKIGAVNHDLCFMLHFILQGSMQCKTWRFLSILRGVPPGRGWSTASSCRVMACALHCFFCLRAWSVLWFLLYSFCKFIVIISKVWFLLKSIKINKNSCESHSCPPTEAHIHLRAGIYHTPCQMQIQGNSPSGR